MTIPTVMTIIGAPGAGTASATAGNALGTDGTGFACLVQMLLAQQQTGTHAGTATADGEPSADPEGTPAGVLPEGEQSSAGGAHPEGGDATRAPADGVAVTVPDNTGDTAGPAQAAAFGVAPPAMTPAGDGTRTSAAAGAATGSGVAAPDAKVSDAARGNPSAEVSDTTPVGGARTDAVPGSGASEGEPALTPVHASRSSADSANNPVLNRPVDTGAAGQLGTGVVSGAAGASAGATAPADAAGPVGGQVFPEVARLVTRGDGTQRLTLLLTPQNLGEVRIVVTVRDGAVDVSLAAGAQAQEALLHGSPELRRLLESIGAASTQIAVRDLPSATQQSGGGTAHAGTSGETGRDEGSGNDPSAQRHTSGGSPPAGPSAETSRSGSTDPTTQASAPGVDLRL